mmetsp:Transcript_15369/g.39613  ORF Transcript_15369/g.39613 Transcript_15369/m.39613 type:complete len:348 (-) Transcript_15369:218-1261(-)
MPEKDGAGDDVAAAAAAAPPSGGEVKMIEGEKGAKDPVQYHPGYPALPLDDLREYRWNHMINLEYPKLQCVYRSQTLGCPVFIVPNFITREECEMCVAKCSGNLLHSQTTRGVIRTSSHVRVARHETKGLHERLAEVTNHKVENMESAKIIRYLEGHHFGKHCDLSAAHNYGGIATLDGVPAPRHCNRELTCFIYLNDVAKGGETAFYSEAVKINEDGSEVIEQGSETRGDFSHEVLRVKPEAGLLVLFFPSCQPIDGRLPEISMPGNQMMWPFPTEQQAFIHDDMWHVGRKAIDEKYILAVWSWPPYVDVVAGKTYDGIGKEDRETDGVILFEKKKSLLSSGLTVL